MPVYATLTSQLPDGSSEHSHLQQRTKLVSTPGDRILVIFGAGHLGWLRQDIATDPALRLTVRLTARVAYYRVSFTATW